MFILKNLFCVVLFKYALLDSLTYDLIIFKKYTYKSASVILNLALL